MIVALAPAAGIDVELQRHRLPHGCVCRIHRGFGDQRTAKIGMQYRTGEIEHRLEMRLRLRFQPRESLGAECICRSGLGFRFTRQRQRFADRIDGGRAAVFLGGDKSGAGLHDLIDRGQLTQL